METNKREEWDIEDIDYWQSIFYDLLEFGPERIYGIYSFAESLLSKYDNAREYVMLHLIIGSSEYKNSDKCPRFDFEGKDSIRRFLIKTKNSMATE